MREREGLGLELDLLFLAHGQGERGEEEVGGHRGLCRVMSCRRWRGERGEVGGGVREGVRGPERAGEWVLLLTPNPM